MRVLSLVLTCLLVSCSNAPDSPSVAQSFITFLNSFEFLHANPSKKSTERPTVSDDSSKSQTILAVEPILASASLKMTSQEPKCLLLAELTTESSKPRAGYTPEMVNQQLRKSLQKGLSSGCYSRRDTYEKLPADFKKYWESRQSRLKTTSECKNYVTWSREIGLNDTEVSEKKLQLAELFADAALKGCMN